jgi:hypothetical protein
MGNLLTCPNPRKASPMRVTVARRAALRHWKRLRGGHRARVRHDDRCRSRLFEFDAYIVIDYEQVI